MSSCRGHARPQTADQQRTCTKAGPHGAVDQQRRRREPARRRRDGGDAQGHAGPRRPAEMCRATFLLVDGEMREAAGSPSPPLRDLPRRVSSSPTLSSLSLLCFGVSRGRLSQHPLDFAPDSRPPFVSRSISRCLLNFPPPAHSISLCTRMAPALSSMASRGRLWTPRRSPYASRQGDGDAYHLEGAWTPSRRLGDALRTLGIICLYSTSLLRFSNIYSVCSVHV